MEQIVEGGFYCVKLDCSGRRLKVRQKNLMRLDTTAAADAGPAASDHAPAAAQVRQASSERLPPAFPQGFLDRNAAASRGVVQEGVALGTRSSLASPSAQPSQRDTRRRAAATSSGLEREDQPQAAAAGSDAQASEAAAQAREDPYAEPLLLSAFNNPHLRRDYGELFERGCAVLISQAIWRRGGSLCGDPVHMREAVLRLTAQLEAELMAARETTEAHAFGPHAAGAGAPPLPASLLPTLPGEGQPSPGMQLLALMDEVRVGLRSRPKAASPLKRCAPRCVALYA